MSKFSGSSSLAKRSSYVDAAQNLLLSGVRISSISRIFPSAVFPNSNLVSTTVRRVSERACVCVGTCVRCKRTPQICGGEWNQAAR